MSNTITYENKSCKGKTTAPKRYTARDVNGNAYLPVKTEWSPDVQSAYIQSAVNALADYEDKKQSNRAFELPCAVGTEVYFVSCAGRIFSLIVEKFSVGKGNKLMMHFDSGKFEYCSNIGKTIFLYRKEAKKVSKELKAKIGK